jgi:hypothetical protein
MSDTPNVIPFGKHRGKLVEELLVDDPKYVEWLSGQDWFRDKFSILYQVIINRGPETQETPEHNALQVLFLDDGFCTAFIDAMKPGWRIDPRRELIEQVKLKLEKAISSHEEEIKCAKREELERIELIKGLIETQKSKEPKLIECTERERKELELMLVEHAKRKRKAEGIFPPQETWEERAERAKREELRRAEREQRDVEGTISSYQQDLERWLKNNHERIALTRRSLEKWLDYQLNVLPKIDELTFDITHERSFEKGGIDVRLRSSITSREHLPDVYGNGCPIFHGDGLPVRPTSYATEILSIEIKPTIGDDYPAVLRQMLANHSEWLFVGAFRASGATREQFVKTFEASGKRVIFREDVKWP